MYYLKLFLLITLTPQLLMHSVNAEFPALQAIMNFLSFGMTSNGRTKDISQMTPEELGFSVGHCNYDFYLKLQQRQQCEADDHYILHLLAARTVEPTHKPPLMVKCLQPDPADNVTVYDNSLLMMNSMMDIAHLLKPIGNATKRYEPGSCVLVIFYTPTSLGCAHVAPYANMLPKLFPTLKVAAIDAFRFRIFNTEIGIVGLPTLLLFHQGRPIVKFYSDVGTFSAFVSRHTGIEPMAPVPRASDINGPLPLHPVQKPDYVLLMAWLFIIFCMAHFFVKSRQFTQICEMIKKIWHESEAQLEHN